jgi:hypothetical protein
MPKPITITYDDSQYVWDGKRWFDTRSYLEPPTVISSKLHALFAVRLAAEDDIVSNLKERLTRAEKAQQQRLIQKALALVRQVQDKTHRHIETVAMLCNILKSANRPEDALALADKYLSSGYEPLLTCRAAILCDLCRWEEGLKQIKAVLVAKGKSRKDSDTKTRIVYNRIEQNAPHLFVTAAPAPLTLPGSRLNMTAVVAMKTVQGRRKKDLPAASHRR